MRSVTCEFSNGEGGYISGTLINNVYGAHCAYVGRKPDNLPHGVWIEAINSAEKLLGYRPMSVDEFVGRSEIYAN